MSKHDIDMMVRNWYARLDLITNSNLKRWHQLNARFTQRTTGRKS